MGVGKQLRGWKRIIKTNKIKREKRKFPGFESNKYQTIKSWGRLGNCCCPKYKLYNYIDEGARHKYKTYRRTRLYIQQQRTCGCVCACTCLIVCFFIYVCVCTPELTPGEVCFSCNAPWALIAFSGLKYVKNAQPEMRQREKERERERERENYDQWTWENLKGRSEEGAATNTHFKGESGGKRG